MVKYYGRSSFVVLCIATVIGLSTVAMGIESGGSLVDLWNGVAPPAKDFCSIGE